MFRLADFDGRGAQSMLPVVRFFPQCCVRKTSARAILDVPARFAWSQMLVSGRRASTRARAQHWGKNRTRERAMHGRIVSLSSQCRRSSLRGAAHRGSRALASWYHVCKILVVKGERGDSYGAYAGLFRLPNRFPDVASDRCAGVRGGERCCAAPSRSSAERARTRKADRKRRERSSWLDDRSPRPSSSRDRFKMPFHFAPSPARFHSEDARRAVASTAGRHGRVQRAARLHADGFIGEGQDRPA